MAANEILPFAQSGGANVLSQAAYAADAQRPTGNQPGIARSPLVNKAALQSSAIAAGVAEFLAGRQNTDVTDQLSPAQIAAMLATAIGAGALLANLTVNVSTAGNDATGDGTLAKPWRTIQYASNQVAGLNSRVFLVTIKCADGAYGENVILASDNTVLEGNTGAPGNCTTTSVYGFGANGMRVKGFTMTSNVTSVTAERAQVALSNCIVAGRVFCTHQGIIAVDGPLSMSGNLPAALVVDQGSTIRVIGAGLITLTGNPVYTTGFASVLMGGILWITVQPVGAATGPRYSLALNGAINTEGGGANYLPGNAAGTIASGGQFV